MSELLKLYTLGNLSIRSGERLVGGFVSRKVEALLVYLAYTGQEQPREILAELLWDNRGQERAASNLRTIISNLQQQLAPYLNITRYSVGLNPDTKYWLDASELESSLKVAQHRWAQQSRLSDAAAEQLEQTLTLYQGDFLAGFNIRDATGFENWQRQLRESLRLQTYGALKRLAERAIELRQWDNGIARARQLLAIDPLQEEAHALLMQLLAQSGQRDAALNQYQACVKLFRKELNTSPSGLIADLFRDIQGGKFTVAAPLTASPPTSPRVVPAPPTPFVTRPIELAQIIETLPQCRLLTLVGHGGIGKTRLAIESAARLPDFPDGIFFVPLSTLSSHTFMVPQIAETIGAPLKSRDELQTQLLNYLRDKTLLLVLDNFEHLIPDGISIVSQLLDAAPQVKFLITSRERLNIRGEVPIFIESMAYPTTDNFHTANAQIYPSVQLLLQSIRTLQPGFNPQAEDWSSIARICRLVEGIPLGLELAASWIHTISLSEIADEIESNMGFLESSFRDLPERHRSLRNVFEYTWARLNEAEQRIFSQLSIFRGGFTRETAHEVAGASTLTLHTLISKSLLKRDDSGRYTIHELVRQYAAQKLSESGQLQQVAKRHCACYATLLEALDRRQWGKTSRLMVDELALDLENYRQAWNYALETIDQPKLLQCVRVLFVFYEFQGRYREGYDLFRGAIDRLRPVQDRSTLALAYMALYESIFCKNLAEYEEAEALLRGCLPILQEQATIADVLLAMNTMGGIAYARGDYAAASEWYEHILATNRQNFNESGIANTLMRLGDIAVVLGQYEKAYHSMSESLALYRQLDSQWGVASVLATLGDVTCKLGQFDRALQYFEESLAICRALGERRGEGVALVNLGRVTRLLGRYEQALDYCEQSLAIFLETGNRWGQAFAHLHSGIARMSRGNLEAAHEQYMASLTLARTVGIKWIAAFALRQLSQWYSAQGFYQPAKDTICEALTIAQEVSATPLLLHALVIAAPLLEESASIELLALTAEHPASEYETRAEATVLLNSLDPSTPIYAEHYARGSQLSLSEAVALAM